MANWYGLGRTNYFKVKDREAFDQMLETYGLEPIVLTEDERGIVLSGWGFTDDGDLPSWVEHPASGEEIEFWDLIFPFVAQDSVLIYMTAGSEKARYATGSAFAYCNGEMEQITLDEIYSMAEERFGITPTQAAY